MAFTRICHACGNSYDYCPTCAAFKFKPRWMALWDTEDCRAVFNILSSYNMGNATAEDVKNVVKQYNIKDFSKYNDSIRTQLEKIMKPIPSKKKRVVVEKDEEIVDIDFN